jgi:hypothetical protein
MNAAVSDELLECLAFVTLLNGIFCSVAACAPAG